MYQKTLVIPEASMEGMLFVRCTYILTIMVRVPILAVCFLVFTLSSFVQYTLGSPKVLEFSIYADGTTHVFYQTDVDPQSPDFTLNLYGNTIDNIVAQDENGTLLSTNVTANSATVETLGAKTIKVDYDTPDLVSKSGKTWTFNINTTDDFSVFLPKNTVIVGMSSPPLNLQIIDNQSLVTLSGGAADINYVFGVLGTSQTATLAIQKAQDFITTVNSEKISTPLASEKLGEANTAFDQGRYSDAETLANDAKNLAVQEQQEALSIPKNSPENSALPMLMTGGAVAAGAVAAGTTAFVIIRKNKTKSMTIPHIPQNTYIPPDKETIFRLKPELRQDDKEMVTFISEKGGQVFESELRKKFLQPRTTMWRAVKRLEREGIVEIEKVDKQNLIKLRKIREETQE